MARLLRASVAVAVILLAALDVVGDDNPPPPFNLENVLRRFDRNGDGNLSREEFLQFVANGPRGKDNPEFAKRAFDQFDADKDGFLSGDEFKAFAGRIGQAGKAGFKSKALPKRRPEPAKPVADEKPPTEEQVAFFEKKIRPVLVAQCYQCHSAQAKKVRGGLLLDTKSGTRTGGDTGPAIVPGDADHSLLVKALHHTDEHLKMPPKQKLPDAVVADFEAWVKMGAPDPRGSATATIKSTIDVEKGRQFWAFQPPKKATPPAVKDASWPRTEIDRFLLAALEAKGLKPVADTDPLTRLRRVYFDLTGLPPPPEAVEAFAADYSPATYAAVVDRLLASREFGERWGRHWLDVARYGETSGKQVNMNYPNAWRYRDYVIASFNADKPFDQFVREQIAGDLLPAADDKQKAERLIATGFLAVGPKSHNERNTLQFTMDLVDEQIDAATQAFMGLTVACARCHDHKFDPIPQHDYYALAGIFRSTETCYGTARVAQNFHASSLVSLPKGADMPVAVEKLTSAERDRLTKQIRDLRTERADLTRKEGFNGNPRGLILSTQIAQAESRLDAYEADGTPKRLAMGVRDKTRPTDSPAYVRGEVDQPSAVVPRGFVQVLSAAPAKIKSGSGRLELADWIASKDNPLTARVIANRVWLHLFGRGLVPTPDNFGTAGQPPSNAALLDTLAVRFVEDGWSVKKFVRSLVLSHAYQLGGYRDDAAHDADPDNALVWHMPPKRLEAEAIRDAILTASGRLAAKPPVGSPVARVGEGNALLLQRFQAVDPNATHRAVYLPVVRDNLPEALSLFDFAEPSLVVAERATTTVPAQALYLLNNRFVLSQAEAFAERIHKSANDDDGRIRQAYLIAFGRPPSESETTTARDFLTKYLDEIKNRRTARQATTAAWSAFAQALFASAEFLYRY